MPVVSRLWEVEEGGQTVREMELEQPPEEVLEGLVEQHPEMLEEELLIIGRQMATETGPLDLLALDGDARPVVIELKREALPRVVIAQALDYASWVSFQEEEDIEARVREYLGRDVGDAFSERFDRPYEEMVVEDPRILIVGSDVPEPVERMIAYLEGYGIHIDWVVVQFFKVGERTCVSTVRIAPSPKKPPPDRGNFSPFLTSVRERTRERLGESLEEFYGIAQVPKRVLGFAPHRGLVFNVSPDSERKAISLSFHIGSDRIDHREVLQSLRENEDSIREKLGTEPAYNWSSTRPIQEYISWSGSREDLTEEMAEQVASRLSLYITTLLPFLPSEPSPEEEEAATG